MSTVSVRVFRADSLSKPRPWSHLARACSPLSVPASDVSFRVAVAIASWRSLWSPNRENPLDGGPDRCDSTQSPLRGDLTLESFPGPNISGLSSTALVSGLGRNKSREKILNESHRNGGIPTRISHTHSGAAPFRFTYPFSEQAVTASRAAVSAQRCIA